MGGKNIGAFPLAELSHPKMPCFQEYFSKFWMLLNSFSLVEAVEYWKFEYCSVVWGPNFPSKLSNKLERSQKIALSIIFRKKVDRNNYDDVLNMC